ncbi:MAG: ComF family protein [Actinomycetales bacterium]|nr:ComF family protein [Actinomycetales bacterium]
MSMLRAGVWDLLLGVQCAGCGCPGLTWCRECERLVVPDPFEVETGVWASGEWRGRLRAAILAWKLGHVAHLDHLFAWHLAAAIVALNPPDSFVLVPVPSTWRSRRERGRHLVGDVCREVVDLLEQQGLTVHVEHAVKLARQTKDQSGLSARDRAGNVRGSMVLRRFVSKPVVIVDDIVTTGSTVSEMKRVLMGGGVEVVSCVSIAASSPHLNDFSR